MSDLVNRIAATIRRVDGSHTLGAAALAEAIAEGVQEECRRAALVERVSIVSEIRAMADEMRRTAYTPTAGVALGAVIDSVADRINTLVATP